MTEQLKIQEVTKFVTENFIANAIKKENEIVFLKKEKGRGIEELSSFVNGIYEYKPISIYNNMIEKGIVKLPGGILEYENIEKLIQEIKDFIHQYMDISKEFETVSAYYVLLTWVYEKFNNLPYLRVRSNPGNGKSRFLNIMAEVCMNPMIFKGDQTESTLFRTIDKIKGTLIIDEADFRFTDRTNPLIKLLNNGFEKGGHVARNKTGKNGNYEPEYFEVYGPKVIANIKTFSDDALESRCITEFLAKTNIRPEATQNLDSEFYNKAKELRNKLLKFRFEEFNKIIPLNPKDVGFDISQRAKQISVPLYTLMSEEDRKSLKTIMELNNAKLNSIRDNNITVDVIKSIAKKYFTSGRYIQLKEIVIDLEKENDGYNKITPRQVGKVLEELDIKKKRGGPGGNTVVSLQENSSIISYYINYYNIEKKNVFLDETNFNNIDFEEEKVKNTELTEDTEAKKDIMDGVKTEDINPFRDNSDEIDIDGLKW